MLIVRISTEQTYPLRQRILRPGQPLSACYFPGDDQAIHLGCELEKKLVGVLSLYNEDVSGLVSSKQAPSLQQLKQWRIRGVAVDENYRRKGFASALLNAAEAEVIKERGSWLWCNARVNINELYLAHDFSIDGEKFMIEGIGEHFRMHKRVTL